MSHVVLCLQLLRTFSHFPQNLVVMVQCQTASAVLGCMTVYMDVVEIQQYGLDVLARIAIYKPGPSEKVGTMTVHTKIFRKRKFCFCHMALVH